MNGYPQIRSTPLARKVARPTPTVTEHLKPQTQDCPVCGRRRWADYTHRRTVATREGLGRLLLDVRRCRHAACPRHLQPYRPEAEGTYALPPQEFGLDVIALVGALRYAEHRSVPEIPRHLTTRGLSLAERTVTNLLARYDELLAVPWTDDRRLRGLLAQQGRVLLALDGLQPDVGHEVLWVLRDCLSGEVRRARSLRSGRQQDLARAVATALPGVPHQRCQFHYLREAARPLYEADRNAKKELKKQVRGVRPLERSLEGRTDAEAEAMRGYGDAVRSAWTDDGRPPLEASGLKLHARLSAIESSLDRVAEKRGSRRNSNGCGPC